MASVGWGVVAAVEVADSVDDSGRLGGRQRRKGGSGLGVQERRRILKSTAALWAAEA
uniref:Uncharacterized protein n=1 Tax=Oryza nivara TaxID=4536 RepID=A0A0E0HJ09_ORYNI